MQNLCTEGTKAERPYPIINTTLNLVDSKKLAWQQRKAASFMVTPLYSGYEYTPDGKNEHKRGKLQNKGYRKTDWYGKMMTMGNVMAISGAAASPNMGHHTSAPLAFLMTIFNVRLGWWLGNPRYNLKEESRYGPGAGLFYLMFELFGKTSDRSKYVYLSDGGHFENLGVYELVKRRCRLIIACDAGEDSKYQFGELGNVIEKCRVDLGVDIKMDVDALKPEEEKEFSGSHIASGEILYNNIDPDAKPGRLIYVKSTLTGDEPIDILRYKNQHSEFPHQTTADQWFNESQFESYRMLGYHIVEKTFREKKDEFSKMSTGEIVERIGAMKY
jgi:hypothetical protein